MTESIDAEAGARCFQTMVAMRDGCAATPLPGKAVLAGNAAPHAVRSAHSDAAAEFMQ